jgi:putative addiction module antidote
MNKPLKLIPVGNSTGVVLPKEVLARLHVERGDQLYLTEAPDGTYRVSAYDPEFAHQMEMAEQIMREDREILRALAK